MTQVAGGSGQGGLLRGGEVPVGSLRTGEGEEQAESGWREEHEQRSRERRLVGKKMGWDGFGGLPSPLSETSWTFLSANSYLFTSSPSMSTGLGPNSHSHFRLIPQLLLPPLGGCAWERDGTDTTEESWARAPCTRAWPVGTGLMDK